jgi:hypothetical protein
MQLVRLAFAVWLVTLASTGQAAWAASSPSWGQVEGVFLVLALHLVQALGRARVLFAPPPT